MRVRQVEHETMWTCPEIVEMLDRYIIGQRDAKRSVAIALRNRWRRMQLPPEIRQEVVPNNIILIGPTGVGKTEIARRLSQLAGPAVPEGRGDQVHREGIRGPRRGFPWCATCSRTPSPWSSARPRPASPARSTRPWRNVWSIRSSRRWPAWTTTRIARARWERSREKIRHQLREGVLDDKEVTVATEQSSMPIANIFTSAGEEFDASFGDSLKNMFPKKKTEKKVSVTKARRFAA